MNNITKTPIESIGYDFIASGYLPDGKDEYHLRNRFNNSGIQYRGLKAAELEILVRNNNSSDNWNNVLVSGQFDPHLVKGCSFFGLIRIGKLEPLSLEFHGLRLPVGLFNSTIISCDFGDNVSIHNVNYFSHFVVGNEVIIANVNELATTSTAKFGNGIIKEGETENQRIWLEICNENGGRKILPFDGMLTADAYLWSKYRDDQALMNTFYSFTEQKFDAARGHYGLIGDRTVIKNCKMIKDVQIGTDAYIKGANKIKNVTVNSSAEASTQIGEGCELVNGIIGVGCRIFYGVKAVRFFMASHSQLKYGARLINSYLGNNATISCCEVLNSLIYPFHEQHHNNSFLCASLLMGQSNVAAGATIGSNHNSRGADGELVAGRGFWPGLCVSLKHNSRFASFTLLAKGDFPFELNIPIPFSLIINDPTANELRIIPAYWFQYNHYALQRNEWKYKDRDARATKELALEYRSLAPDSINEIFNALDLLCLFAGKAYFRYCGTEIPDDETCKSRARELFNNDDKLLDQLEILAEGFENSKRKVVVLKARKAYASFKEMIRYYAVGHIATRYSRDDSSDSLRHLTSRTTTQSREEWVNIGGQLLPSSSLAVLLDEIKSRKLNSWEAVHLAYKSLADSSDDHLYQHAVAALLEIEHISLEDLIPAKLSGLFKGHLATNEKVFQGIVQSREKDMTNPFRKMVYANETEMEAVLGKLNDNSFILEKDKERKALSTTIENILAKLN
ncbi:MAG: DUF4954 family protein [bacterium]|jgi:hypothetical protein